MSYLKIQTSSSLSTTDLEFIFNTERSSFDCWSCLSGNIRTQYTSLLSVVFQLRIPKWHRARWPITKQMYKIKFMLFYLASFHTDIDMFMWLWYHANIVITLIAYDLLHNTWRSAMKRNVGMKNQQTWSIGSTPFRLF